MSAVFEQIRETVERRPQRSPAATLTSLIATRAASIGVIGMGYVGLPLAKAIGEQRFSVVGFDADKDKVKALNAGESYIKHIGSRSIAALRTTGRFSATADFARLADCDVILICVPTPLNKHREPDLSFVVSTAKSIRRHLRRGQLIVLESTTYPGTTTEVVRPVLETSGLKSGVDFFLAYSPEREDPGNINFSTPGIPKVVGGDGAAAAKLATALYSALISKVVPVSSLATAEAVKLTENIFRAVNIALVNELKLVYGAMGIDIWEVIEAAKTKPFGFMPFYPGPGLGGHCIPIDPFYLTWKAREYGIATRFIELAGEINLAMPRHVVDVLQEALNRGPEIPLGRARILIIGLAYKKNVGDVRESPSFKLIRLLEERGATVAYHDPHVPELPRMREYPEMRTRNSAILHPGTVQSQHAVVLVTDHDAIDYAMVAEAARLIIDTRNVFARHGISSDKIIKA